MKKRYASATASKLNIVQSTVSLKLKRREGISSGLFAKDTLFPAKEIAILLWGRGIMQNDL